MKKFFIYLFIGILSFSLVFSNYYKSAHAMDWVSGALSFTETLTWVLATLGITCTISDYATETDKSREEFWNEYEADFYSYVNEHDGNTASDRFIEWKDKLCRGVLDKSSEYWDIFKSWAISLVSGNSSGSGGISGTFQYGGTFTYGEIYNTLNAFYNINSTNLPLNDSVTSPIVFMVGQEGKITQSAIWYPQNSNVDYHVNSVSFENASYGFKNVIFNCSNGVVALYNYNSNGTWGTNSANAAPQIIFRINSYDNTIPLDIYVYGFTPDTTIGVNPTGYTVNFHGITFDNVANTDFDSSFTSDISNTDVISSSLPDEADDEVALPMPGVSDSDDDASADAYDEIIDAINDGTITQEEGIERIQEILKVIVYDTVTDDVLPRKVDPDTGENEKKEDKIQENKDNMTFTLGGLENVFPFCIPFDIYAFMTLLVADPVAPKFDYPIQSVNGEVEEIHVDLTPFEPVAVVVRYVFDFLFIIGLGILTRSLIGGGGSD